MKLSQINKKKIKVLHNLVAFKWLKLEKTNEKSAIIIPETAQDGNEARLGHKYLCEAIAIGNEVYTVKPGDRFLLHEYGKVDQGSNWNSDDVLFCEEPQIIAVVDKDFSSFTLAKNITKDMEEHFLEGDEEVKSEDKQ